MIAFIDLMPFDEIGLHFSRTFSAGFSRLFSAPCRLLSAMSADTLMWPFLIIDTLIIFAGFD